MMLMKGNSDSESWPSYIQTLMNSGMFRGGSALGNGVCISQTGEEQACTISGFIRFEAESLAELRPLLQGNPILEAGGKVELVELIED